LQIGASARAVKISAPVLKSHQQILLQTDRFLPLTPASWGDVIAGANKSGIN
jgi:hypothetical protein